MKCIVQTLVALLFVVTVSCSKDDGPNLSGQSFIGAWRYFSDGEIYYDAAGKVDSSWYRSIDCECNNYIFKNHDSLTIEGVEFQWKVVDGCSLVVTTYPGIVWSTVRLSGLVENHSKDSFNLAYKIVDSKGKLMAKSLPPLLVFHLSVVVCYHQQHPFQAATEIPTLQHSGLRIQNYQFHHDEILQRNKDRLLEP